MKERLSNEEKVQRAIAAMGSVWVLHPSNRVQRLKEPLPEVFAWKPAKVLKGKAK